MRDRWGRNWFEISDAGKRYPAYTDSTGRELVRFDRPLAAGETIDAFWNAEYGSNKDEFPDACELLEQLRLPERPRSEEDK